MGLKIPVLIQVSLPIFPIAGINVAMINRAYAPMAKELHNNTVRAGY